ncbi:hypothetical protein M0R88_05940 [Halorussus gelatinilyticus]|uniref:Uncharacterized protein n=1 Tax=Halorussus gelatinilyticus TaxID=2937524 RepID=A0A8U0IKH2_9EURY|nr:hypothetical protein [Halorussus gelatinilyticus]UPW01640.1 hypothetical protein M0R88_05940 [Halorussus gelatinilyticus]
MTVAITIHDEGRIEARHNSERVLWEFDIDRDDLPHNAPADEQLATGAESFFEFIWRYMDNGDFEQGSNARGGE